MFDLIYDIREVTYSDFGAVIFYIFFLIIMNFIIVYKRNKDGNVLKYRITIVVMFFVCFGITSYNYLRCHSLRESVSKGEFKLIEGDVSNIKRLGKNVETFEIGGVILENQDRNMSSGYGVLSTDGGVIQNGNYLRISYYRGRMLVVEKRTP